MISAELAAFAEDPGAYAEIGTDEERVLTDEVCVTFSPGEHYWSTSVERVRFEAIAEGLSGVRDLMRARGRSQAAWALGPSASHLLEPLIGLGLESESDEGSAVLVLDEPPRVRPSAFEVIVTETFEEHLASIEISAQGFGYSQHDAEDERRRARETFESERAGGDTARMIAYDGGRPVATGRAWFSPFGLYLGGGATLPGDRSRGAMSALIASAWGQAALRGTPALVMHAGPMAAPALQRLGARNLGTIRHLIDRNA